jgi:hypothetical protein
MTKDFCDRCGELIPDNKYSTGKTVYVDSPKPNIPFIVEIKIGWAVKDWKLCTYCCREIIHEAYTKLHREEDTIDIG